MNLNSNDFAIYCYYTDQISDNVTNAVKNSVKYWREISMLNDIEAAELIRADETDILFDLSGHTSGNRLPILAYRPAKIQISGIGYMNSTGLNCVDYFLSDKFCAGSTEYFSEKIIRLPHTHLCYTPYRPIPELTNTPCIKNGYVTFGCFNNFSKVNDEILTAWQKILRAVRNSRLILKSHIFGVNECRNFVMQRLQKIGFDITRIDLRGFSANYLDEYREIDIALDTYPYVGGGTTCDALYMGVPVISMYGARHGTRFGYSILNNIGVGELATANVDDYINLAIGLANDYELLSYLHKNLRGMMERSPIMNQGLYIREIEAAFKEIYMRS